MSGRKTLALFYEYFRIDKPIVNTLVLQGLYKICYAQFTDRNLVGSWEAWKEVVRKLGTLITIEVLTQELVRHLSDSPKLLKDEMRAFKSAEPNPGKWKWDDVARIVTAKIREQEVQMRTDQQWQNGPPGQGGVRRPVPGHLPQGKVLAQIGRKLISNICLR